MAALQSAALKHWARIIKRWPVDKVRPENVSFQTVMQRRLNKFEQSSTTAPITSPQDANTGPISSTIPFNETSELQQTSILYSFLENRYSKAYPMAKSLRYPASSPTYYDDLIQEMAEAPSRSWFASLTKKVKGSLRFR